MATKKTPAKKLSKIAKPPKKTATYAIGVGSKVPDFHLESTSGETFRMKDFKSGKVVLYFYPKDSTSGCTLEGHDFSKLNPAFQKAGVKVFGISRDSMRSHTKFKDKEGYKMDLLSDESEEVCKIFDVIQEKSLYGRKFQGVERSTFVIEAGKITHEWRKVKVPGHAEKVLEAVRG